MNWITRNSTSMSAPYRVVRTLKGFYEAWVYSPKYCGCLGRQMTTLEEAKQLCERDAEKRKEMA